MPNPDLWTVGQFDLMCPCHCSWQRALRLSKMREGRHHSLPLYWKRERTGKKIVATASSPLGLIWGINLGILSKLEAHYLWYTEQWLQIVQPQSRNFESLNPILVENSGFFSSNCLSGSRHPWHLSLSSSNQKLMTLGGGLWLKSLSSTLGTTVLKYIQKL